MEGSGFRSVFHILLLYQYHKYNREAIHTVMCSKTKMLFIHEWNRVMISQSRIQKIMQNIALAHVYNHVLLDPLSFLV